MPKNSRHLCITIDAKYGEPIFNPEIMQYLCYGLEVGSEKTIKNPDGYKHYQTYVELKKEMSYKDVHQMFGGPCRIAIRRGTKIQAINYCQKDGLFKEFGDLEQQGQRNDIKCMMQNIKEGKNMLEVAEEFGSTWAQNYRAMFEYKGMLESNNKKRDSKIIAIVGPPDTGKTILGMSLFGLENVYFKTLKKDWYDAYAGQKIIVFDEFRQGSMNISTLLSLVSPIPYLLPVKGRSVQCKADTFVIISNYHPSKWFQDMDETTQKALYRRIHKYINVYQKGAATILPAPPPPTSALSGYMSSEDMLYWTEEGEITIDEKKEENKEKI